MDYTHAAMLSKGVGRKVVQLKILGVFTSLLQLIIVDVTNEIPFIKVMKF